ncbi:MAG: EamA family transporter [Candidatus Omnitrophica bacterium]|nr:EamA family transporter [Candidatus Omnitrophota bacterium]
MFKKKITLKMLGVLIFVDVLETFTHLFFKKSALPESALQINSLASALIFLKAVFSSPFLWCGLLTVFLVFIIWSTILSKIDLSVAVSVCSFSYILVPVVSIIFLHEDIGILRWLGIFFILIGIIFVASSSKEKIEVRP